MSGRAGTVRKLHGPPDCSVRSPVLQVELGDLAKYDGPQHKGHAQLTEPANYQAIESGLTFLGLCGLMDPPRPEVITPICCVAAARLWLYAERHAERHAGGLTAVPRRGRSAQLVR